MALSLLSILFLFVIAFISNATPFFGASYTLLATTVLFAYGFTINAFVLVVLVTAIGASLAKLVLYYGGKSAKGQLRKNRNVNLLERWLRHRSFLAVVFVTAVIPGLPLDDYVYIVAGANSAIWTDIYIANRDALAASIERFGEALAAVRATLAVGDAGAVREWNERARASREALLGAVLGAGAVHELRASVPNRPGVIAEIALALGRAGANIADMALSPSEDNRQGVLALWIDGDEEQAQRAQEQIAALGFAVARA